MIIRDYLICLLQMYLLEDLERTYSHTEEKNSGKISRILYRSTGNVRNQPPLESSILNMVMIPVIVYDCVYGCVPGKYMEEAGYGMLLLCAGNYSRISLCGTYECIWRDWCVRGLQD